MKQRIFSHFQDYLIQYISHQYQDLLYCNSSQYSLSTYNSQRNNNNNAVLAMTMPYSGQGWRHNALPFGSCTMSSTPLRVVHYVFNPNHYIGIVIANTTLLYKYLQYINNNIFICLATKILFENNYKTTSKQFIINLMDENHKRPAP